MIEVCCDHYIPSKCDVMKCGHGGKHFYKTTDEAGLGGCDFPTCECFEKSFPVKCVPIKGERK